MINIFYAKITSNSGIVNGPQQGSLADTQNLVLSETNAPSNIWSINGSGNLVAHVDCLITVDSFSHKCSMDR